MSATRMLCVIKERGADIAKTKTKNKEKALPKQKPPIPDDKMSYIVRNICGDDQQTLYDLLVDVEERADIVRSVIAEHGGETTMRQLDTGADDDY